MLEKSEIWWTILYPSSSLVFKYLRQVIKSSVWCVSLASCPHERTSYVGSCLHKSLPHSFTDLRLLMGFSDQLLGRRTGGNSRFSCWSCLPMKMEKEMATHSSVLAWKIPGIEESGGLKSIGSQSRTQLRNGTHMQTYGESMFWSGPSGCQASWPESLCRGVLWRPS